MRTFKRILVIGGAGVFGAAALAVVQIRVGALFGVGSELDAFFVGAAIPSVLLAIAAATITSLVVPRLPTGDPHLTAHATGRMTVRALIFGAVVALVVELFAPVIVALAGPGLDAATSERATEVLRIYAIAIPGTAAAFVYGSLGYAAGRVWASGLSTAAYGLAWLALLTLPQFSDDVASVALAGVLATGVQVVSAYLIASHGLPRPRPVFTELRINRGGMAAISAVVGTAIVARTGLLLDPLFGSLLAVGSVSQLSYAARIASLAILVCGQGAAFSLLISEREESDAARAEGGVGMIAPLMFSTAAAALLLIAGPALTELILVRGALTAAEAERIAELLRLWTPAIMAFTLVWALEAILYAQLRTSEVFTRASVALAVNVIASAGLVLALGIEGRPLGVLAGVSVQLALLVLLFWDDERFSVLRRRDSWIALAGNALLVAAGVGIVYGLGVAADAAEAGAIAAIVAAASISLACLRSYSKRHPLETTGGRRPAEGPT